MMSPWSVIDRPGQAGWGLPGSRPWLIAIATSIYPREDPSATPRTHAGASRSLGSSHSISIGQGAVGPPRSGFVLRLCIRKADEARGEPTLTHGLADTRFCRRRIPK